MKSVTPNLSEQVLIPTSVPNMNQSLVPNMNQSLVPNLTQCHSSVSNLSQRPSSVPNLIHRPSSVPNLNQCSSSSQLKSSKCGGDYCYNTLIRVPPYDKSVHYYINSRYIKIARLHRYSSNILKDLSIPSLTILQQIKEPTRFESFIQRSSSSSSSYKVLDALKEPKKSRSSVGVCYKCVVVYYNIQQKYSL